MPVAVGRWVSCPGDWQRPGPGLWSYRSPALQGRADATRPRTRHCWPRDRLRLSRIFALYLCHGRLGRVGCELATGVELFGIVFSIPVAFVASMVYCAVSAHVIRRFETLRRWLYGASLLVLVGFLAEVALLATLGAVGSRALVGPAFYIAHSAFFFFGTPALANALLLRRRGPVLSRWYAAGFVCTAFALCLVLLQYGVSEALYGIDGTNGPYSAVRSW